MADKVTPKAPSEKGPGKSSVSKASEDRAALRDQKRLVKKSVRLKKG